MYSNTAHSGGKEAGLVSRLSQCANELCSASSRLCKARLGGGGSTFQNILNPSRHTIVLASLTFLRLGRFVPHAKALDWFFHSGMFCHQTSCDWFLLIFQLKCQPFNEFCTHSCPQHPVPFVFPPESLALPLIVGEGTAHVSTLGGSLEPAGSSNTTLVLHYNKLFFPPSRQGFSV